MGLANAQRTLNYIRIFTEYFTQPEYTNLIPMFGILNEAVVGTIGVETLTSLCVAIFTSAFGTRLTRFSTSNLEAHRIIRDITGVGEGKGPFIVIGNAIGALTLWPGLLPNADRLALDTHPYFAFNGQPNIDPVNITGPDGLMGGTWPQKACSSWQGDINDLCVTIINLVSLSGG